MSPAAKPSSGLRVIYAKPEPDYSKRLARRTPQADKVDLKTLRETKHED